MELSRKEKFELQRRYRAVLDDIHSATNRLEKLKFQKERRDLAVKLGKRREVTQQTEVDKAAQEAATSPKNELPEPTQAQKEAGNYKKGRVTIAGMDISIENPKGSTRTGTSQDGTTWSTTMHHHYGDIKKTTGADNDSVDVFIGDAEEFEFVYVVDQIDPIEKKFDEHKVMLGFTSTAEAKKAYLKNYDENWQGLGKITAVKLDEFKRWVYSGQKTDAYSYINGQLPVTATQPPIASLKPLNYDDYNGLDRYEIKQQVIELSNTGYGLDLLKELMTHWLDKNKSVLFGTEQENV